MAPFHATRRLPPKKVSFYRRHAALYASEKLQIQLICKRMVMVTKLLSLCSRLRGPRAYRRFLLLSYLRLINPDAMNRALTRFESRHRTIDSFADVDIPGAFRFKNKDQLRRLMQCLQIPAKLVSRERCAFGGEEALLVTLYRLRRPTTVTDIAFKELFGFSYQRVSLCVRTLMDFVIDRYFALVFLCAHTNGLCR